MQTVKLISEAISPALNIQDSVAREMLRLRLQKT